MLASIMRIVQCEQRGRSMGVSDGRRKSKPVAWRFPAFGRERAALSVTDSCRRRGGDGTSIGFRIRESVVNIAQSSKLLRIATGFPQVGPEPSPSTKLVCVLPDAIAHASGE